MAKRLLIITQKVDVTDPFLGFFVKWLKELARHFDELRVLCLAKGKFKLPSHVRVISLGKEFKASRSIILQNFLKLIIPEALHADAVFVHMTPIWVIIVGPIFKTLGKPVFVWYVHKSIPASLRIAEPFCTKIFTASRESCRLKSKKVRVLSHGIDVDFFKFHRRLKRSSFNILSVSRITLSKNIHLLISAFAEYHRHNARSSLVIVGGPLTSVDKPYFDEAKVLARKAGVSKAVVFAGAKTQEKLLPYLYKADSFVNLSTTGSVDKAVLEAMATGLPTITSNEAFKNIRGVINVNNKVESVVEGFEKCANMSDSTRVKIAHLSRKYAEKHSLKKLMKQISNEIKKAMK